MWLVYTILVLGVVVTVVNTVLLVGIATLLVRYFESMKQQEEPKRKQPAVGLTDIATSQIPYNRAEPVE
jgi:hypothetical protein